MSENEIEIVHAVEPDEPDPLDEELGLVVAKETPVVITPDEGVEVLKRQLAEALEARRATEARAAAAEERASALAASEYSARTDKHETDIQIVEGAIAEMERNGEVLKAGLEEAYASGDAKRAAEITAEMTDTGQKLHQLRAGFDQLKSRDVPKPAVTAGDPVESMIAAGNITGKAADWIRAHPETATDKRAHNRMIAAHHGALAEDLAMGSAEYFAHLDKAYAPPVVAAVTEEVMSAAAAPAHKVSEAPVVAPSGRGGNGKTQVTLTRDEREIAEMSGLTPQEYAKNKLKLAEEGKLGTKH